MVSYSQHYEVDLIPLMRFPLTYIAYTTHTTGASPFVLLSNSLNLSRLKHQHITLRVLVEWGF